MPHLPIKLLDLLCSNKKIKIKVRLQFYKLSTMRTRTIPTGFVFPMDRKQHMAELPERVGRSRGQDPRDAFYRLILACTFLPIRRGAALVNWKGRGSLEGHWRAENPLQGPAGQPPGRHMIISLTASSTRSPSNQSPPPRVCVSSFTRCTS